MIRNGTVIIFFVLLNHFHLGAQSNFNFGVELGASITKFPNSDSYIHSQTDQVNERESSIPALLIGVKSRWNINSHWGLELGVGYQILKESFYRSYEGRVPRNSNWPEVSTYNYEWTQKQTFHKLILPITSSYTLYIGKFKPSLSAGVRLNYFIYGNFTDEFDYKSSEPGRDSYEWDEYDPTSAENDVPIDKLNTQVLFGLQFPASKRIWVNILYAKGFSLRHEKDHWDHSPDFVYFNNEDFTVGGTWFFRNLKSK